MSQTKAEVTVLVSDRAHISMSYGAHTLRTLELVIFCSQWRNENKQS